MSKYDRYYPTMRTILDSCLRATAPWMYRVVCDEALVMEAVEDWQKQHPDVQVFFLQGEHMKTDGGYYSELTHAFSLPDYCGHNLNALFECLTDNDVLLGTIFVIVLLNGDQILASDPPQALEGFLDTLKNAGEEWAIPVNINEPWGRPSIPFHTIFHQTGEVLEA